MTEISLITASLALIFALIALLLAWKTSIGLERVAELVRALDSVVTIASGEIADQAKELPAPRLIEMEGICRALKEQYDQVVIAFEQHRAAVHRSMQRFDQIMRRDEKAAAVIEAAKVEADEGLDIDPEAEEIPDTQEGDRGFLRSPEEVETILSDRNGGTWEERRRAMSRQYYENRGGQAGAPAQKGGAGDQRAGPRKRSWSTL